MPEREEVMLDFSEHKTVMYVSAAEDLLLKYIMTLTESGEVQIQVWENEILEKTFELSLESAQHLALVLISNTWAEIKGTTEEW